ncbi:hypothetical protein MUB15_32935 [Priestia sp. OVS21]|nr:hypothetical protein [Priestia sp. OVS21]
MFFLYSAIISAVNADTLGVAKLEPTSNSYPLGNPKLTLSGVGGRFVG